MSADAPPGSGGAARTRSSALRRRLDRLRATHPWLDLTFELGEHDRQVGGGVLASALAFRLFLWFLPAALVVVGGLGLLIPTDDGSGSAGDALSEFIGNAVSRAGSDSHRTRWFVLGIGVVLLLLASAALARTLNSVVAATWRLPIPTPRLAERLRDSLALTVSLGVAIATSAMSSRLREMSPLVSVLTSVAMAALWAVLWWRIQLELPHPPDVPSRMFWPGAVLMGVGFQALHLFTVVYLGERLRSASSVYGVLGGVATFLFWTYLSARLVLAATSLGVVLVDRQRSASAAPSTVTAEGRTVQG